MLKHLTKKGYWAASMDVGAMPNDKDGYHVCEIHQADQKYMTVDLGETLARVSLSEPDVLAILAQAHADGAARPVAAWPSPPPPSLAGQAVVRAGCRVAVWPKERERVQGAA